MTNLFISYRREDAAGHAGRLADHLLDRLGQGSVFMDVESIGAGTDFTEAIASAIGRSEAVLVVIGPAWLTATAPDGSRRLHAPEDFVRREIEAALAADARLIPVLVAGATMPSESELPDTITPLARRNAVELQDRRWREDVGALVDVLEGRERGGTGNLPLPPTRLLGRERELSELIELLQQPETRLVTLTGPGGVGKTHLTLEAGARLASTYTDGGWFVELAALRDPALVVPTIATVLGLREGPGTAIEEVLTRHLRKQRILLVLDNLEQLVPGAAPMLSVLVANAPGLDVLVSSREPLGVRAERVYPVGELRAADAVTLFAERARSATPGFELDDMTRPAVEEICRRLDGLPLAIELTAAHVKILSPTELLDRLDDRLPLLTGGARDAPERQRTMGATIAWSYDLLDEDERGLFASLAVFSGGCTLEAAQQICGADLATMAPLVDKSLLRTEERPPGVTRYVSLETIREFAGERLAERPESEEIHRRHVAYLISLATRALPGLKGREQDVWLERLAIERDNVRAAIRWSLDAGDPDAALELAALTWEFWPLSGDVTEARAWLAESLERADHTASEPRALALAGVGWLANGQGDGAEVAELILPEALRCAEVASPATGAYLLAFLGEALPGDPGRAIAFCEQAVATARATEDRWLVAITLNSLAERSRREGDNDRAGELYEEELQLSREIGDRYNEALSLVNLGETAFLRGDEARAHELFARGRDLAAEIGAKPHMSYAFVDLGWVALSEDRFRDAEHCFRDAVATEREVAGILTTAEAIAGLAGVAAAEEDDERAGTLLGVAEGLGERLSLPLTLSQAGIHDGHLAAARDRAGDRWDGYRSDGRRMDLDAAIDSALG